jgi:hypothetical protein
MRTDLLVNNAGNLVYPDTMVKTLPAYGSNQNWGSRNFVLNKKMLDFGFEIGDKVKVSYDWETTSTQGHFSNQLWKGTWRGFGVADDITPEHQSGHCEVIFSIQEKDLDNVATGISVIARYGDEGAIFKTYNYVAEWLYTDVAKGELTIANVDDGTDGTDGADGADGRSITGRSLKFRVTASSTKPTQGWSDSGWLTTMPTTTTSNGYLWQIERITYSIAPLTEDIVTLSAVHGSTGAAGAPGTSAPTITTVQDQYYLSTSNSAQSGGSWSTTVPTWASGKYYWSRVATTYSNSTTTYSTPVFDAALNQSLVSALEVATVNQSVQRVVNNLAGATICQSDWQQGTINSGVEAASAAHVRSGFIAIEGNTKYMLQTFDGQSVSSLYGTVSIFYYEANKTIVSNLSGTFLTVLTTPASARFCRILLATANAPETISAVLVKTDTTGYVDLTTMSSVTKLTTLQAKVEGLDQSIGVPFKVKEWEQGTLDATTGLVETTSASYLRSKYLDVVPGEKYIGQLLDGSSLTLYCHFYAYSLPYVDYVPVAKLCREILDTGSYTLETLADYLDSEDVENKTFATISAAYSYNTTGDNLAIYQFPLAGKEAPEVISWTGRSFDSINSVWLYTGGGWTQIATVTSTVTTTYNWTLTSEQQEGITGDNLYLAFFAVRTASYAGFYTTSLLPFLLNPSNDDLLYQLSTLNTSGVVTIPANTAKIRVRVGTTQKPDVFSGNVYQATTRTDYTKSLTMYSSLLMTKDVINLRVAKGDVINQINVSPESILIAGNKVHITGTTTIDTAVIKTAMIADAQITDAKISTLNAAKITTGTLSADRIAANSITSAKLSIANGYITNAMIADATIGSAKIASLDAAKITTGTLSADRIAANSITSAKLSVANGFITNAMIADATITSAKIASLTANKITAGTLTGFTIQSASSGDRIVITGSLNSIRFIGTFPVGTVDANFTTFLITSPSINFMGLGSMKPLISDAALITSGFLYATGIRSPDSTSWGLKIYAREVGGMGGISLLDDTGKYGIHITAAEVLFIRNNSYYTLGDILRGYSWSV